MPVLTLDKATKEIAKTSNLYNKAGNRSPFFFMVGAGVSAGSVQTASEITDICERLALQDDLETERPPSDAGPSDRYFHWLECAYPDASLRHNFWRELVENAQPTTAHYRLAHMLLSGFPANHLFTANFDDLVERAVVLLSGSSPIVCDHASTLVRLEETSTRPQIAHLHGTYHFYDCKNLRHEIGRENGLKAHEGTLSGSVVEAFMSSRMPIVIGYSGWTEDIFMNCLKRALSRPPRHNLYWFCHRREDFDLLPSWLKESQASRFVLPSEEDDPISSRKLLAANVCSRLVKECGVRSLGFFGDPIGSALERFVSQIPKGSDPYSLRLPFEQALEARRALTGSQGSQSPAEAIRSLRRAARYADLLSLLANLDLQDLDSPSIEELLGILTEAFEGGFALEATEAIERVCRFLRGRERSECWVLLAPALYAHYEMLSELNELRTAGECLCELIDITESSESPESQDLVDVARERLADLQRQIAMDSSR